MRRKDKEKTDLPVMALGFPVVWATCLWADTLPFACFFSVFFFSHFFQEYVFVKWVRNLRNVCNKDHILHLVGN